MGWGWKSIRCHGQVIHIFLSLGTTNQWGDNCVEKKNSRLETQGMIEYARKHFPYNNQMNLNKSLGHGYQTSHSKDMHHMLGMCSCAMCGQSWNYVISHYVKMLN